MSNPLSGLRYLINNGAHYEGIHRTSFETFNAPIQEGFELFLPRCVLCSRMSFMTCCTCLSEMEENYERNAFESPFWWLVGLGDFVPIAIPKYSLFI
jgi:hypothetical protein